MFAAWRGRFIMAAAKYKAEGRHGYCTYQAKQAPLLFRGVGRFGASHAYTLPVRNTYLRNTLSSSRASTYCDGILLSASNFCLAARNAPADVRGSFCMSNLT